MDSPFSFQDTSMVFHAAVQRRQAAPQGLTMRTAAAPPRGEELLPVRRAPAAHYAPDARSYSPLPALPTLLRARHHVRSMPDHGLSPILAPVAAAPARVSTAPVYRPRPLATHASLSRDALGFIDAETRASSGERIGAHYRYQHEARRVDEGRYEATHASRPRGPLGFLDAGSRASSWHAHSRHERDEGRLSDEDVKPFDAARTHRKRVREDEPREAESTPWYDHRLAREESVRGRFVSDSSADSQSYTSSPVVYPPARGTTRTTGSLAIVRPVEVAVPTTEPTKKKRKARICTTEGCTKYVVDHGLCIRHGGGKRCYIDGCDCRAQNRGLCWKHGGFTICKVDGCTKRAKSRGICWSHGGGTRCKRDDCSKIAVSNGLCWAHGGGKRCVFGKCRKPASERTENYCNEHFAQQEDAGDQEAEL